LISHIKLLELLHNQPELDYSSKDISKNIGLKVNTIDKKVSRGIQKLKKLLGGII